MISTGTLQQVSQCLSVCSCYFSLTQRQLFPATTHKNSRKMKTFFCVDVYYEGFLGEKRGICVQVSLVATVIVTCSDRTFVFICFISEVNVIQCGPTIKCERMESSLVWF